MHVHKNLINGVSMTKPMKWTPINTYNVIKTKNKY